MTYDSCRLCGERAALPGQAMQKACERNQCPGAKLRAFASRLMADIPVARASVGPISVNKTVTDAPQIPDEETK